METFKNRLLFGLVLSLCMFCLSSCSQKDETAKLLEDHATAMGGKQLWQDLRSYHKTLQRPNGMTLDIKCLMPDQIELKFKKDSLELSKFYDGEHGYIIRNGKYQTMRQGEAIEMAEEPGYYSELIFAKDKGWKVTYLGKEKIDSILCDKISVKKNPVDEQIYWLDEKTHLIYLTGEFSEDASHDGIYYKTKLENYKKIKGYAFPFKQTLIPSDRDPVVSIVTSVEVNLPTLKPSYFSFEPDNTRNLISYWKDRYSEEQLKAFTFVQETIELKENGKQDTSTWYEVIQYPNHFRMDFGSKEEQNRNLYRNDSIYVLRAGKEVHRGKKIQEFMIMEGALFSFPVDSTLAKLKSIGADASRFYTTLYQGRKTYVLGAEKNDTTSVQIWLDAERRNAVRRFSKTKKGKILEVRYSGFKEIDGYAIESWLEFYLDGQLIQTERYKEVVVNPELDQKIFDPQNYLTVYWY